jgi:hypothetical protein
MAMLALTIGPLWQAPTSGTGSTSQCWAICAGCHTNDGQPAYSGGRAFSAGGKHLYPAVPIA